MNSKKTYILLLAIGLAFPLLAQHSHNHDEPRSESPLQYISNLGQWSEQIKFEAKVQNGSVYLEQNCLTFAQYSASDVEKRDELYHDKNPELKNAAIDGHAWKVHFLNSSTNTKIVGKEKQAEYHNYFIGNDQSKWIGYVPVFNAVQYTNLFPNIDLKTYSSKANFKYDFIVHPGADVFDIAMEYEGLNGMRILEENLVLETSVGKFMELAPFAYQLINGKKVEVLCTYVLKNDVLSFGFPTGYNKEFELVIDPILVGATLSGTTGFGDNYGHASTFDAGGNIYTGAINFTSGYPATVGAFQLVNSGGGTDIAISKLSPNASTLIYATHLGGLGAEYPHSMFVNGVGELFVLGTSSSTNFPTTVGAHDNVLGGTNDIVITHFNTTGSGLIGSTFVGGALNDGTNSVTFNYGDSYRGEIVVDAAGDCYVASTTNSSDFPTTPGAFQTVFGGNSDAVFFKMNGALTSLMWSTLLGGTSQESGFGLRLDNAGDVYACGTTDGTFMTANGYQTASLGGNEGFIVKLTGNGSSIPNSTYVGTIDEDNAFFLDIDINGKIYVYGQTSMGNMTTTPGAFVVAGSGQYINRFDPTLVTREISTLIGGGSTGEFVPIAFMVDNCGYIYFSGHNVFTALPTSTTAIQTSGGFYLGVLTPDATAMHYSTHYGGPGDHVDGGTSRFDPMGIVYQGVCTASGFNTTVGAHSSIYPSGWDIGVFKIDFQLNPLIANASFSSNGSGCAPITINFTNLSNGTSYVWDFGDGSPTSTSPNPSHTYVNAGSYVVTLIANSSTSCVTSDTAYFNIDVPNQIAIDLGPDLNLCSGTTVLDPGAFPGATYLWQDASTNQTFTVAAGGTYYVTVTSGPCSATDTVIITYGNLVVDLGPDEILCPGSSILLDAGNPGSTYLWSTGSTNQTITATAGGTYWVQVNGVNCIGGDTIQINLLPMVPEFNVVDTIGCAPLNTQFEDLSIIGTLGSTFSWDFGDGGIGFGSTVSHQYLASGQYTVTMTITTPGGCVLPYSKTVNILIYPSPTADFTFTPTQPEAEDEIFFTDQSSNALSWIWDFGDGNTSNLQNPSHIYDEIESFEVTLTVENNGCFDSLKASISFEDDLIYYIPNAFTPDNDGYNHVFQPIFTEGFSPYKYHLWIFNRWGEIVFESYDPSMPWDGTYNGKVCQQGVYTWKIDFGVEETDKKYRLTGHVSLLK